MQSSSVSKRYCVVLIYRQTRQNSSQRWSSFRRGHYVQNTQQTNDHALSRIRTRNPRSWEAKHLHLRRHGHRDHLL